MGSIGSPIPSYAPNPNEITTIYTKDCWKEICSTSCPQWCSIPLPDDNTNSGTSFSPLIIALITILGAAFLLIIYYFFISKHCKRREERDQQQETPSPGPGPEENLDRMIVVRSGLDDGRIGSITVFKYRRGDGLVESTECAVCLSEFREEESLRLLPNCSHAFHINCIDAWLKSHSNCPLCRANGDPFLPPNALAEPGLVHGTR